MAFLLLLLPLLLLQFLDDTERLLWTSPDLISRLKELQAHLNSLMAFHAEHQHLLHSPQQQQEQQQHQQQQQQRPVERAAAGPEEAAATATAPKPTATSAAAATAAAAAAATAAAAAATAEDTVALHAALEQRLAALYALAELPPAVQQRADCWSLGKRQREDFGFRV